MQKFYPKKLYPQNKLKAWSTAMAQPVETATILNAQPFWNKQTDATKRIISPASWSIIKHVLLEAQHWKLYYARRYRDEIFNVLWRQHMMEEEEKADKVKKEEIADPLLGCFMGSSLLIIFLTDCQLEVCAHSSRCPPCKR